MSKTQQKRLLSLDTLRGFDMLWIAGLGAFFTLLGKQTEWGWADALAKHMHHAPWGHFYFFDLIFPLFMFMSGVAIPYAIISKLERGIAKKQLYKKVVKRAAILVVFGMIFNGALRFNFANLRVASVLGQIGLAYLIAASIAIHFKSIKSIVIWIIGILAGYSILQWLVPVPGYGAGDFTGMGSINGYIDRMLLPGRPLSDWGDPEGLLSIISASTFTLMGVVAGMLLRSGKQKPILKVGVLGGVGVTLIILALVLRPYYPIIKALATPTYNLIAGGWSFLLLALFFLIIDVWKVQKWTFFFRVIGLNSITIYMGMHIIPFKVIATFFFGGLAKLSGNFEPLIIAAGVIAIEWLMLYFLFKKNVFLKV